MDGTQLEAQEPAGFDLSSLRPRLARELVGRLFFGGGLREDVEQELERLEHEHGAVVYAELLHILAHLRFEPQDARVHWGAILRQRDEMERHLGPPVELRLALLRYFTLVHPALVNPKIIELSAFECARASAYTDELTGARNYRFLVEFLRGEVLRTDQYGTPFSLVMADVDWFKLYNDEHGHEAGNAALAAVARLLTQSVRQVDAVARYGGEEFAVVLPCTGKEGAALAAERMRGSVEAYDFAHGAEQPGGRLSLSLGVATYPADARDFAELVRHADRALYEAKRAGRNRVRLYADSVRSFPRVATDLDALVWRSESEPVPLRVVQLSEGGMLAQSDREIAADTLIEVRFSLPGCARPIRAAGRVLRVRQLESGWCEVGVRFVECGSAERRMLSDFLKRAADRPPTPD